MSFFKDNADLQFYFEKGIDWDALTELTEFFYRNPDGFQNSEEAVEFYRDVLELIGDFVASEVAPYAAEIDREAVFMKDGEGHLGARQDKIFKALQGLELYGMCLPRELGGLNVPLMVYMVTNELFARADVSVCAHYGFHGGMAMAMLFFSLQEGTTTFDPETAQIQETRFADFIEEIRSGAAWGCMDITEPDAGSDMAALRAKGEQDEDGNWYVTGQKIFITSGHGKFHFVIARTEPAGSPDDPFAGLGGLSMFLVPTYIDHPDGTRERIVSLDRLEEKLGHHGSATAALTFERAPAYLIGKRGEGFKYMLTLMNGARVGVGFESIGLCEAAYRLALDYAAERRSMGKSIDRHEMIADYLDEMRIDIIGLRALAMHSSFHDEMAKKLNLVVEHMPGLSEHEQARYAKARARHKRHARRLTPLLKYLASERAIWMARMSIQIHGGSGYTTEYGAEKLLRDAVVMPIYEGTSQIQALMAMKDTLMGIMKNPQGFVRRLAQARWRSLSARDPLERRVARLQALSLSAQQHLMTRTAADKFRSIQGRPLSEWADAFLKDWNPKRDFGYAMLHAERLIQLLADEAICEILLEQSQKHEERRPLLEDYLERAEPRVRFLHDQITTTGSRLLGKLGHETPSEEADVG